MIFVYLVTLGCSSTIVGLFAHHMLAGQGYAPAYEMGLLLASGAAAAYLASQMAYAAFIYLIKPPKGPAFYLTESLSHACTAILLPPLFHVTIPWPEPILAKAEPLILLGACATLHAATKLFSFFAALQSRPSSRLWSLAWTAAAFTACFGGWKAIDQWLVRLDQARPRAPQETAAYDIGGSRAIARAVPEGSLLDFPIDPSHNGRALSLMLAATPETSTSLNEAHIYITLHGTRDKTVDRPIRLQKERWAMLRIPSSEFPEKLAACSIFWTTQKEPAWRMLSGLRPIIKSEQTIMLAGPSMYAERGNESPPNFVILAVDGMGSLQMSRSGYSRPTTPQLDRLAATAIVFNNAYAPALEAPASLMSLLTGLDPLAHGFLGAHQGPLPSDCKTITSVLHYLGYATAAFTEGQAANDLSPQSDFSQGFDLFDAAYAHDPLLQAEPPDTPNENEPHSPTEVNPEDPDQPEPEAADTQAPASSAPAGSRVTLENARDWIDNNAEVQFMAFIRLHELVELQLREQYGAPFNRGSSEPTPRDIYDTALAYLDRQIAAFIKHVRDRDTRKNTIFIITAPYGLDLPSSATSQLTVSLSEPCLHIPLYILGPGLTPAQRNDFVGLQDIAPSLLYLAGLEPNIKMHGSNLMESPVSLQPISMAGDPLVFTMRNDKWRFYWHTQRKPFSSTIHENTEEKVHLFDIASRSERVRSVDQSQRFTDTVRVWRERLTDILQRHDRQWLSN